MIRRPPRSTLFPYTTLFRSPAAVRRPGVVSDLRFLRPVGLGDLAARDIDHEQLEVLVGEGDLPAVRRPDRREGPAVAVGGQTARRGGHVLRADPDLVLARLVGDPGDGGNVGGPGRAANLGA